MKNIIVLIIFLFTIRIAEAEHQQYTVFNSPYSNKYTLLDELRRLIYKTPDNGKIHGAIYSWTGSNQGCKVFTALKNAVERGVYVSLVIDGNFSSKSSPSSSDTSEVLTVCGQRIPVSDEPFQDMVINYFDVHPNAHIHLCKNGGCISRERKTKQHEKFWLFSNTTNQNNLAIENAVYISSGNLTYSAGARQTNDVIVISGDQPFYNAFVHHFDIKVQEKHFPKNDYYTNGGYFQSNMGKNKTYNTVFWSPRGEDKKDIWTLRFEKINGDSTDCKLYINNAWHQVAEIAEELKTLSQAGCDVKMITSKTLNPSGTSKKFLEELENYVEFKFLNYGANLTADCNAMEDPVKKEECSEACISTHHKYVVFQGRYNGRDTRRVWAGSHNFTGSANSKNDENIVKVSMSTTVDAYLENFDNEFRMEQRDGYNTCNTSSPSS